MFDFCLFSPEKAQNTLSLANQTHTTLANMSLAEAIKTAEEKIKQHTGRDIEVVEGSFGSEWNDFMAGPGTNSLGLGGTWHWLERGPGSERQRDLWEERDIKKIIIAAEPEDKLDEHEMQHTDCIVHYESGSNEFTLSWCPRALKLSNHRKWFCIHDDIQFGLRLYQLDGCCFYKSDFVDDFEDIDENSCLPNGTGKFQRWLQFRHWTMMWFEKARPGWNYKKTNKPPQMPDGSDFNMDCILDLPDMPSMSMPSISLPSLPDVELPSLPSLPDMPSVELPSIDPSMPSFDPSMPSLGSISLPSMDDRKYRPKNRWACHGIIELKGLKVKASGSTLILSDATVHHFWQQGEGNGIDCEKREHQRMELSVSSSDQAKSWFESLIESKCEEGDEGGCCTIA